MTAFRARRSRSARQPEPLSRQYRFVEQPSGADGGKQRLDAHHQTGDAGGQPPGYRHEYPAQINAMHHQAGDADVKPVPRVPRPGRTHQQRHQGHQREHQQVADQQEAQRLGMRQTELGADEAGTPEQDEQQGGGTVHQRSSGWFG